MMALQEANPAPAPSAQVVGNAFVEQYYHILHQSPELVYRFYQDSSVLSRPDANGSMTSVTTMNSINEKILSLDYQDYKAEIKTADAQESYKDGVIVVVTGCLTGKDSVRRKFTQTFFLAPQEKGYYVLNDIFRYVEESESVDVPILPANGTDEIAPEPPLTPDPESADSTFLSSVPVHVPDQPVLDPATSISEEDLNNGPEVCDPSDVDEGSVIEEEVAPEPANHPNQNEVQVFDSAPSAPQEDAPKSSYASIVAKSNAKPGPVHGPVNTVRVAPTNTDQQSVAPKPAPAPAPAPEVSDPGTDTAEGNNVPEDSEGYSIYIRNLPLYATVAQLEEVFKTYGPIKRDGIQVRSNKLQGFCFGFVEFELPDSVQRAIEASPIRIGGRQAAVEEKRTTTRVTGSGRGRFAARNAYRSDSFRGRGNYSGGRGYGRNDFRNQGEFSGRARGSGNRGVEGYQRVDQNGNGRGGRQGGSNQTAKPA
ncbi:Nuclear transport factor 2 domain [Dillenia turbinata]|uniref:Nuclear transport factor 2 domain n=1 Tax=Dillenia turbinata TaxID=194707 RepID=A0AAN8VCY9_9MAGN